MIMEVVSKCRAAPGSNLYAESLVLTSATFAAAMSNLIPAITLLLAIRFRERHLTDWKLGWNIRLLAAAYTGVTGSAMTTAVTSWGGCLKGPLYVSSFSPLGLLSVAVVGSLILDEQLHLGSMIGSMLIIVGLYMVLWGKSREMKIDQSTSKRTQDVETTSVTDRGQDTSSSSDENY